jgi:hypothetical protein
MHLSIHRERQTRNSPHTKHKTSVGMNKKHLFKCESYNRGYNEAKMFHTKNKGSG